MLANVDVANAIELKLGHYSLLGVYCTPQPYLHFFHKLATIETHDATYLSRVILKPLTYSRFSH